MEHAPERPANSGDDHDQSLVEWFATLSPDQRLAELDSRVAFLWSIRVDNDAKLSRNPASSE
jgi:hypothetical protein